MPWTVNQEEEIGKENKNVQGEDRPAVRICVDRWAYRRVKVSTQ